MTSSLAQQLKKLAVPESSIYREQKKKASLLFDPKEAASIDRETFYEIGLSGLAELKTINPAFAFFENNLFNASSKDFERAIQTKQANEKLDSTIQSFLLKLSPYFLLQPSHKALEWLVNRFQIHKYNKNDVFSLILPYHETKIFVRFLQILKIDDPTDFWYWLEPLQKPGIHLTKTVLYNHCTSNVALLRFISEMTKRTVVENEDKPELLTTLFAFYCSTVVGTLEHTSKVTEPIISSILPGLMDCLSSPLSDLRSAGYMITAQIVLKTQLKEKVARHLVKKIIIFNPELSYEAVLLLQIIFESQHKLNTVSEKCLMNMTPDLLNALCANLRLLVDNGIIITKFLLALMRGVLPVIQRDIECLRLYSILPEMFIADINIDSITAEKLIRCTIDCYSKNLLEKKQNIDTDIEMEYEHAGTIQTWYSQFMNSLEQKFPAEFDKVLKEEMQLQKVSTDGKLSSLSEILGFTPHVMKKLGDSYLFEKLYHQNFGIRLEAVNYIKIDFTNLLHSDSKFLKDSVVDRLNDDNPKIVDSILDIKVSALIQLIPKEELLNYLKIIIDKGQLDVQWWKTATKALEMICLFSLNDLNESLILSIMPYLFPTTEEAISITAKILNSPIGNMMINDENIKAVIKLNDCDKICINMFDAIKNCKWLPCEKTLIKIMNSLDSNECVSALFILICLTSEIPESYHPNEAIETLKTIMKFLKKFRIGEIGEDSTINGNKIIKLIKKSKENVVPIEAVIYFFEKLILKTKIASQSITPWMDFDKDCAEKNFVVKTFEIVLHYQFRKYNKFYSTLLKAIMDKNLKSTKEKIEFIANLIMGISSRNVFDEDNDSTILLIRCVRILEMLITKLKDIEWIKESKIIFSSLIICLHSPEVLIRRLSIEIIDKIVKKSNSTHHCIMFYQELITRQEELQLDNNQLTIIINKLLSPEKSERKLLEKSLQNHMTNTLQFLLDIILEENSPYHIKNALLSILCHMSFTKILEPLSSLALNILSHAATQKLDYHKSQTFSNIVTHINSSTMTNCEPLYQLICESLKSTDIYLLDENEKTQYVSALMMQLFDQETFEKLPLDKAQTFINLVLSAGTFGSNPTIITAVSKVLKRIEIDADHVLPILKNMITACTEDKERSIKRKTMTPSLTTLEKKEWKLGVTLLEHIQDKKKFTGYDKLMPELFSILKKCLEFEEQTVVEYVKQLLLTSILDCCQKIHPVDGPPPKKSFDKIVDIELIILCIRGTQNPQTHHHALMLLSHVAFMFPKQVLQHMMSIFTFIGSSILRQDDAYSFQIISKIIETVIPILIQSDKMNPMDSKSVKELEHRVIPVLRIFVDAILDIPEHRRFSLFKKLLVTLNPENYLWAFFGLLFESHIVHGSCEKTEQIRKFTDKEQPVQRLDFAMSLVLDFPPDIIMSTCNKLLSYLKSLPEDKTSDEPKNINSTEIFSTANHTAKQLRHFKYTIITFLNSLLSSPIFVQSIDVMDNKLIMEQHYKNFIVNILTFIQTVSKTADQNVGKPQAKYWKVMLHHCYEVLDNANNLLSPEMFTVVIRGLMNHNLMTVKRKAMEILNTKLQQQASFFANCDKDILFGLLDPLLSIIKDIDQPCIPDGTNKQETELNQQTALLSLKLLVRMLCRENPKQFKDILDLLTGLVKSTSVSGNLMASIILCLAELCSNLKAHAISTLPKLMPALIKILKSQTKVENTDLVLLGVITATYKIVETIPLFLSPYLEKLLYYFSILSAKWDSNDNKNSLVSTKLGMIKSKISTTISPRVLIPVINQCYDLLLKKGNYKSIGPAMNVLAESFSGVSGPEFTSLQTDLTNFFLNALQFRCDHVNEESITPEQIDYVEEHIIKALVALVLKLSESSFRPLYYKIYDWSTRDTGKNFKYRTLTFYRLSSEIANSLRGLFILFAGHFVKNAADLLNACNKNKTDELYFEDEQECCLLVEYILKTLNLVFTYDTQNFVNRERFEAIMQPLVDQLDNTIGGMNSLIARGKEVIIPCIAQFAVATADDSLWKPLNYQILLKTRHNDSEIRLLGLECVREMATKLGDSWLPLLPESVPFLAELLEDDVQNVEAATQKAIQTLESVLGEPLQKYF